MKYSVAAVTLFFLASPVLAQQLSPAEQIQDLQATLNQEFHIAHEQRALVTALKTELSKLKATRAAQDLPKPEIPVPAKP